MDLFQAFILALVQGATEFLPVSSSAHLILVPSLTDWPDQGLAFDVAMNTATWCAVVIYFRRDLTAMAPGLVRTFTRGGGGAGGALAWKVLAATVPVAAAGLVFHDLIAERLRSVEVIGVASIVWGLALWAADRHPGRGTAEGISWPSAVFVGLAQALALVPGTSRSGITITAGLFTGLSRPAAARFSFLLAVVVGGLAGAKEGADMLGSAAGTPWAAVALGFAVAFTSAYLAIHYFLKLISRSSMTPFVAYRVALGVFLLAFAYLY